MVGVNLIFSLKMLRILQKSIIFILETKQNVNKIALMWGGLTENIRELIIPKLRELYPEKMQDLLKESRKNSSDRSVSSLIQVKKVSPEPFNQRHIKILERILRGESDLSSRDEKTLTSFGIDINVLRFNGENSDSYQEQMIRVRQKLAFLKLKFHT